MISAMCKDFVNSNKLPAMITPDDLKQEFFEYLLRYTSAKARKESCYDNVWLPFIKRSLRNCYLNVSSRYQRGKRDDGVLNQELAIQFIGSIPGPEEDVLYDSLVKEVRSCLSGDTLKLFNALVNPKSSLLRIARKKSCGNVKINNKTLSLYFRWSQTKTSYVFHELKKDIRNVLERDYSCCTPR